MSRRVSVEPFSPHELEFFTFGDPQARPHALITAGLHGGEATGIYVAKKLIDWLGQQTLSGRVTVLPVANPGAFRRATRTNPYDDLDLNRSFPGDADGSPTKRLAAAIWEEAKQADLIVDLHCCGIFGSDYTLALWQEFPEAQDLASDLDFSTVIQSGGTRGQLFVEACHAGIPAVVLELAGGQMGASGGIINSWSSETALFAVTNLLVRQGVVEGEAMPSEPDFYGKLSEISARRDGVWSAKVKSGAFVEEGEVLGLLDKEEITSPVNGVATTVSAMSFVFPGDTLVMVAPRAEG
ncbi:MAG TPA: succinylglutamate desuccinylase/aspartoacylase family protein [Symbiobacteriaceae bacterium]|nr:succinylglutamate desuccinylase/aspartoacylase family protein [Symbiobacteriaceae bacterium]